MCYVSCFYGKSILISPKNCLCVEGTTPGADLGPVISPQAKQRILDLIQSGVDQGAKLLLDGRNVNVKGYEAGNFVGPTIITNVTVR